MLRTTHLAVLLAALGCAAAAGGADPAPAGRDTPPREVVVFAAGTNGYASFRIPAVVAGAKGTPPAVASDATDRARHGLAALERALADDAPPVSWRLWYEGVAEAEEAIHLGTAGVADEAFWAPVHAYATRHRAPPPVTAALDLLHGIGAWDWPRVIRAAPVLAEAQRTNTPWVSAELLRDAVVTAHLRQGDPAEARAWLARLTRPERTTDPAYNLRTRLLSWYVADAMAQAPRTAND